MFNGSLSFDDVAHAIQLALTPIFLLTGVAGILNVMTGRLARIIDRGRALTETPGQLAATGQLALELGSLERRRHLASAAITACTSAALLTCLVVGLLFLEVLMQLRLKSLIALLFMATTLTLVVGLSYFLREVHLATRTVRIPLPRPSTVPDGASSVASRPDPGS